VALATSAFELRGSGMPRDGGEGRGSGRGRGSGGAWHSQGRRGTATLVRSGPEGRRDTGPGRREWGVGLRF